MPRNPNLTLVQHRLFEIARAFGFVESGRTFRKLLPNGLAEVIHIQAGERGLQGIFTVNLGVFVPECHRFFVGEIPSVIDEVDCEIRTRLGKLLPEPGDAWWSHTPPSAVALDEVGEALRALALPFVESLSTREAIVSAWRSGRLTRCTYPRRGVAMAMVLAEIGDAAGAREALQEALSSSSIHSKRLAERAVEYLELGQAPAPD